MNWRVWRQVAVARSEIARRGSERKTKCCRTFTSRANRTRRPHSREARAAGIDVRDGPFGPRTIPAEPCSKMRRHRRQPPRSVTVASPMNTPTIFGAAATVELPPFRKIVESRSDGNALRAPAEQMFARGAVINRVKSPPTLVGDFLWEEPNRILWFAAFGDQVSDAQSFEFHYARVTGWSLHFRHSGGREMEMTPIEHAAVEDPDDYRIAWQLWQQVAPLRIALIRHAYDQLRTN